MAENNFNESSYKFTDPIRKFKANDPYYWEVDNIPLSQLEENIKWLKDQLNQKEPEDDQTFSVNRSDINELKPYSTGEDRFVKVKPGRYTARINDASTKTQLQVLTQVLGKALAETDAWSASTLISNSELLSALEKFKSTPESTEALGMTGLEERSFTWSVRTVDTVGNQAGSQTSPQEYTGFSGAGKAGPFLSSQAMLWAKSTNDSTSNYIIKTYDPLDATVGFSKLPLAENHFIKYWRGIARTAIVDVPEELEIQVPEFDLDDFNYVDEAGTTQSVPNVKSRIDLVYLYSKPVDANRSNIFKGGTVESITKPQLGIVRGAGIGASFKEGNIEQEYLPVLSYDSEGNPKILSNPSDSKSATGGFISAQGNDIEKDMRGSFPSPDDLMNLAPLLSEELQSSDIELVGQSILPLAYVFVTSTDLVVNTGDVIDIRPFFRTTELAYNERSGLAAAMPQISLANPVVGKAQLDDAVTKTHKELINLFGKDKTNKIQTAAIGYVFGGGYFGPEGVLISEVAGTDHGPLGPVAISDLKPQVSTKYGIPQNFPMFPDWDIAFWVKQQALGSQGSYGMDYIDRYFSGDHVGSNNRFKYSSLSGKINPNGLNDEGENPSQLDIGQKKSGSNNTGFGYNESLLANMHYVKKKIYFDRDANPWMADYKVDVSFLNSIPCADSNSSTDLDGAKFAGAWVEKSYDHFTIYVGFQVTVAEYANHKSTTYRQLRREENLEHFSTFLVPVEGALQATPEDGHQASGGTKLGFQGNSNMGICTLPSVMWEMTTIPNDQAQYLHSNLKDNNSIVIKPSV